MKTSKLIPAITIAIAIGAMSYTGCKKESDSVPVNTATSDRTISGINEMSVADASFNDAVNIAAVSPIPVLMNTEPNSITPWGSSCAVVTADIRGIQRHATIDFGTGCVGNDGNFRSGKINIVWEGTYGERGSYYAITFEKYSLNHNKIDGTAKLENIGYNKLGNIEFQVDAIGSISVAPREPAIAETGGTARTGEITMTYSFHGFREWISGMWTKTWNDDVYLIRGSSFGTTLSHQLYKTEIVTPLRNEMSYPYYTSGTLNLRTGDALRVVDFGYVNNGQDDVASVIVGDVMTVIHLNQNPLMIVNM